MNLIDSAIAEFYTRAAEDSRLQLGLGPLEFERNRELIGRYLDHNNMTVADIGGGTGHYAKWIAGQGHAVVLVDPVEKHIKQARQRSKKAKCAFECVLAEARDLPFSHHSFDLVILHGPLYHLQEYEDRMATLREAKRVLKPGGTILGFAITHAASTLAALQSGLLHQTSIFQMCQLEMQTGLHDAPEGMPGMLPMAYFHRPQELIAEIRAAGLLPDELFAVEGLAWMDNRFFESWNTPEKRKRLLDLVRITESDRELLCFSPHMMVAASIDHLMDYPENEEFSGL